MGIPTHLTIQDYFKQRVSACFQPKKCNQAAMDADTESGNASFSKSLAEAKALSVGKAQGLSIQDYMQRRIPSHRPTAIAKVPSSSCLRSPVAPSTTVATADHHTVSNTKILRKASLSEQVPQENDPIDDKRKILASIKHAATQFGLPAALIKAVVKAESNYQVQALSPAGAQGLMQLMPATAKELGVTDPFDIDQNIRGGAQYLRNMLDQFDGDLHLALTAYNAGPGTVARYAGNVPYAETRTYVQRVMRYAEQYSSPEVT
jgi:soluble lytic murein transglycosylase-like protein